MFEHDSEKSNTNIKVIGVGGAGGNAVNHMAASGVRGVDFICTNTDAQALAMASFAEKIQLGESGLGAGSNPEVGRETAIREKARIAEALRGAHMVFVTAGMGGGTGTGAAPIVAEVAKEMGILTVGVVSKPFSFEGDRRMRVAEEGIDKLSKSVDSLIIVLNERLMDVLGEDVTQKEAFKAANDVLRNAVAGIAEIINVTGLVNVDFQDVRTVMTDMGTAMMGTATASGPDRATIAAQEAIACPLLDGTNLAGARGLLVNIAASEQSLKIRETREVLNLVKEHAAPDAVVKFGAVYDDSLNDEIRVTVVATGLSRSTTEDAPQGMLQKPAPAQQQFNSSRAPATAPREAIPPMPSFTRVRSADPAQPASAAAPQPVVHQPAPAARVRDSEASRAAPSGTFAGYDVPPFLRHRGQS